MYLLSSWFLKILKPLLVIVRHELMVVNHQHTRITCLISHFCLSVKWLFPLLSFLDRLEIQRVANDDASCSMSSKERMERRIGIFSRPLIPDLESDLLTLDSYYFQREIAVWDRLFWSCTFWVDNGLIEGAFILQETLNNRCFASLRFTDYDDLFYQGLHFIMSSIL